MLITAFSIKLTIQLEIKGKTVYDANKAHEALMKVSR